ncbi:MAG: tRNA (guanosine(37)-N1)-methyltransferase TrmD [Spirochaetaceae bacterium]|jgi:tRNA (guanine37-N1)-methyltransferase|nr:tRNA (guanosine(37)-N1)-methyltransferase TrmD [Spirochaetaceae bacterium]
MKYTVLSLFPELIEAFFGVSIPAKAVERGIIEYHCVNIRDFAYDKHKSCDDAPYGGGAGMLMLAEPLGKALDSVISQNDFEKKPAPRVIYMSPSGRLLTQALVEELAGEPELLLICGHYEGIDQRIIDVFVDDEISVGDYVLSSGETAALVLIDATFRLLDKAINPKSLGEESFHGGLLEYPQWTRPEVYSALKVPEILLSGHHENIRYWRLRKRIEKTVCMRPDLIEKGKNLGLFDAETLNIIMELVENE